MQRVVEAKGIFYGIERATIWIDCGKSHSNQQLKQSFSPRAVRNNAKSH
jgi:hypothetical protein